jgi:flagellar export protein FliJ
MAAFRLSVVLRLREMAEDQAKAHVAAAVVAHRTAYDALVAASELERQAQDRLRTLQGEGGMAGDIVATMRGIDRARQGVAAAFETLEAASTALVRARAALAEASRRREVVERLKERMHRQLVLDEQRREDAVLSELAGVRYARGMVAEVEP